MHASKRCQTAVRSNERFQRYVIIGIGRWVEIQLDSLLRILVGNVWFDGL